MREFNMSIKQQTLTPRSMGRREQVILADRHDSTGHHLRLASVAPKVTVTSNGPDARIACAGMAPHVVSSGMSARIAAAGHASMVTATGYKPFVACAGQDAVVTVSDGARVAVARSGAVIDAGKDCSIVCAEPPWKFRVGDRSRIAIIQYPGHPGSGFLTLTAGDNIKADQWYMIRDAELLEAP